MKDIHHNLNELKKLSRSEAGQALFHCCGSAVWSKMIYGALPVSDEINLRMVVDLAFAMMTDFDWLEAFGHHPMIGDVASIRDKFASTAHLAASEQSGVDGANEQIFSDLANLNQKYFNKFGFIFIICASGKSAEFMLKALETRIENDRETEMKIAAAEQKKITWLRLAKIGTT